jgi:Fe-Mn family superoxide dismutase
MTHKVKNKTSSIHQRILKLANKTKNTKLLKLASRKEVKDFLDLRDNPIVSEELFDAHIGLYEGYVKALNSILDRLDDISKDKVGYSYGEYSELKRRLAVPYNGVVLHELYFMHLLPGKQKEPTGELEKLINQRWNNLEGYIKDVKSTGISAGNGWVVTVYDPILNQLDNYLITEHHIGFPAGCIPIMVMDCWEHAFAIDYKTDRETYIEKFLENLDYDIVASRLKELEDDKV